MLSTSDDSGKHMHAGSLTALLLVLLVMDGGLGNGKNIHEQWKGEKKNQYKVAEGNFLHRKLSQTSAFQWSRFLDFCHCVSNSKKDVLRFSIEFAWKVIWQLITLILFAVLQRFKIAWVV